MKNKDIVIWQGIKAQIIGGPVDLAYNNGIGYKIKLLEGQSIGKRLYVKGTQLKMEDK